jgi:hypothetical protein
MKPPINTPGFSVVDRAHLLEKTDPLMLVVFRHPPVNENPGAGNPATTTIFVQ